jgi:hypothetical protein
MMLYKVIDFLHIVGAMALTASLAFEWYCLRLTTQGSTRDVGQHLRGLIRAALASIASAAVVAASGVFMMATVWGRESWLVVAMGPLIPFLGLSTAVTLRKVWTLQRQWDTPGYPEQAVRRELRSAVLQLSLRVRSGMVLGITYLMVAKPGFSAAVLGMVAFLALAIATALPSMIKQHYNIEGTAFANDEFSGS